MLQQIGTYVPYDEFMIEVFNDINDTRRLFESRLRFSVYTCYTGELYIHMIQLSLSD